MKELIRIPSLSFLMVGMMALSLFACTGKKVDDREQGEASRSKQVHLLDSGLQTATFAAGCFWCVEAQFQQLAGVKEVISGYTGGTVKNPSYEAVCTGKTGHAEAVNIVYDPDSISFEKLLEAFFVAHDPTQLNRQGNDIGTQYRSAIFYHDSLQQETATLLIKRLNEENVYPLPIVTSVEPYGPFYEAEDYHKNYYKLNPDNPYCQYVIQPKMEKFKKVFKDILK